MRRTSNDHIICKQSIEIKFDGIDDSFHMHHRVAEVFYERLEPALALLFDEYIGVDEVATIDHLNIDCGIIGKKDWEDTWVNEVLRKIKTELNAVKTMPTRKEDMMKDHFLTFLKTGLLPWNSSISSLTVFESEMSIDELLIDRLRELLLANDEAVKRLVQQFSTSFILRIAQHISDESKHLMNINANGDYDTELPFAAKRILALLSARNEKGSKRITTSKPFLNKKVESPSLVDLRATEIFIENAGLVLLHPFLPTIMQELELTVDNQWRDLESQLEGLLIMQYLVTSEASYPEYSLPLNKILCGLDMSIPVATDLEVTERIHTSSDELLSEVIRQWSRLKNTGIDGLRETFLKRPGKLSTNDNGWLLQVEQKSVDVLLGGLPWGISVIKLPWMNSLLYVDWV